ncbi:MAG: hypothetical protein WCQ23_06640 [Candidatus Methanomethylophilaceae archaeon]
MTLNAVSFAAAMYCPSSKKEFCACQLSICPLCGGVPIYTE